MTKKKNKTKPPASKNKPATGFLRQFSDFLLKLVLGMAEGPDRNITNSERRQPEDQHL